MFSCPFLAQTDTLDINNEWQKIVEKEREEKKQMILNHNIDIKRIYPYNQAEKVEIIAFYSKQNDYKNLLKDGKVNLLNDEIDGRKFLDRSQIYKLAQIFNNPLADLCHFSANCYNPKHLIIFYDKKEKPFSFIELCLECLGSVAPDKKIINHSLCDTNVELLYGLLYELSLNDNPEYFHYLSEKSIDGLYKVEHKGKVGFIDDQKKIIIPLIYDSEKNDTEIGRELMNQIAENGTTEILISFRRPQLTGFRFGVCPVIKNGKYGLINVKNEVVVPFIYEGIDGITPEYTGGSKVYSGINFIAKKNGKYGIVGLDGIVLQDFIYHLIVIEGNGYYFQ